MNNTQILSILQGAIAGLEARNREKDGAETETQAKGNFAQLVAEGTPDSIKKMPPDTLANANSPGKEIKTEMEFGEAEVDPRAPQSDGIDQVGETPNREPQKANHSSMESAKEHVVPSGDLPNRAFRDATLPDRNGVDALDLSKAKIHELPSVKPHDLARQFVATLSGDAEKKAETPAPVLSAPLRDGAVANATEPEIRAVSAPSRPPIVGEGQAHVGLEKASQAIPTPQARDQGNQTEVQQGNQAHPVREAAVHPEAPVRPDHAGLERREIGAVVRDAAKSRPEGPLGPAEMPPGLRKAPPGETRPNEMAQANRAESNGRFGETPKTRPMIEATPTPGPETPEPKQTHLPANAGNVPAQADQAEVPFSSTSPKPTESVQSASGTQAKDPIPLHHPPHPKPEAPRLTPGKSELGGIPSEPRAYRPVEPAGDAGKQRAGANSPEMPQLPLHAKPDTPRDNWGAARSAWASMGRERLESVDSAPKTPPAAPAPSNAAPAPLSAAPPMQMMPVFTTARGFGADKQVETERRASEGGLPAENASLPPGVEKPTIGREIQFQPSRIIAAIAEAARSLSVEKQLEIRLNPEELGRVRLGLQSSEQGMSVLVNVERPDTLDLLRRNIDLLAQQLRELGYEDLTFSFSQDWQGDGTDGHDERPNNSSGQMTAEFRSVRPELAAAPATLELGANGRLDIRL